MIQSMTGFAISTLILEIDKDTKINVTISIKTLNSRFFETNCKLPYALGRYENDFIKILKNHLHRGYIYFIIHMSNQNLLKGSIEPSIPVVESYINAVDTIKQKFNIHGELSLHDILQLPAVFNVEEKDLNEKIVKKIFATVKELSEDVVKARKVEGEVLQHDIQDRVKIMQKEIKSIEDAAENFMEKRKNLIQKEAVELDELGKETCDLRKQMMYAALDKIDIHEEIIRFKSHLKNLLTLLKAPGIEKGKRIDFTLQELAREINTIAAKCSDAAISSMAINIKVELEKAREQAQNVL